LWLPISNHHLSPLTSRKEIKFQNRHEDVKKIKQRLPWSYRLVLQQRDVLVLSVVSSMIRNPQEWGQRASSADNSSWYDSRLKYVLIR
jgi:hypothetical protein